MAPSTLHWLIPLIVGAVIVLPGLFRLEAKGPVYPAWFRRERREKAKRRSLAEIVADRKSRRFAIVIAALSALIGGILSLLITLLVHPIK